MLMKGQRNWTQISFGGDVVGYRVLGRHGLRADILPQGSVWHVEVVTGKDSRNYKKVSGSLADARTVGEDLLRKAETQHKKLAFRLGDEVEIVNHQAGTHFRPGVRAKVTDISSQKGNAPHYSIQHAEGFRLWVDGADIRKVR